MSRRSAFWLLLVLILLIIGGFSVSNIGQDYLAGIMTSQTFKEKRNYVIGVIHSGGAYQEALDGLQNELKNKGFVDGENLTFIVKNTGGSTQIDEATIKDILSKNPDVIYSISTPITSQVQKIVGNGVPIVFNIVGDPIGSGFVKNYSSPGTNLTGCSNLSAELSGKRLEIFKKAFPNIQSVVTFYNPENSFSLISIENTRKAAEALKIKLTEIKVKDKGELEKNLAQIGANEYGGIYITPDAMVVSNADVVVKKASELKIPTMGHEETLAEKGVTLTYGANFYRLGIQCASVVSDILEGQEPQNIPVRTPNKLDITINSKSTSDIKIEVSSEIQNMADKIIR